MYLCCTINFRSLPNAHVQGWGVVWREKAGKPSSKRICVKMDAVEQQKKTVEGYTRMVLDSEQEKLPILDSISQVIDTFGKDQGRC